MIVRDALTLIAIFGALCTAAELAAGQPAAGEPGPLKVGLATVDITPEGPVYMAGFAARKEPSEGAYAPIFASCVVFDNAVTRVAIMAIDVCKIGVPQMEKIRAAARQVGIPPQHVMINSSHTHCGPTIIGDKNADYLPVFEQKVCGLLQNALDDLQEASLDYAIGSCLMGVNRRQVDDAGHCVGMRPEPRKEIDSDVPVLRVLTPTGDVRAVIFGYACHPTTMGGQEIGPDYPGPAREWIAAAYPDCLPVFLQGCGGDIKPRACTANGRFGFVLLEPKELVAELGHELGRAVVTALAVPPEPVPAHDSGAVILGGITRLVKVPDKEEPETKSHEIYNGAWRIGDLYLFGSQCELCSPIGLRIKRELSHLRVWPCGYTHWGGGYIVDAAQFPEGGYEVNSSVCAPETEEVLVRNAVEFIRELQQTPVHEGPIPGTQPTDDPAREARQEAIRGTLATYAGEPRMENGHVDIERLIGELTELNCNTYDFLIWHAKTDWEDLRAFLHATEGTDLKVWVSLVPPSESRATKSEPFGLDYVQWANAIGELSAEYPRLVAWSIDDFTHNLSFYTPEYLQQMMDAAHAHNPLLAFVPCTYFPAATADFVDRYSRIIDGLLFYYRHESAGANLSDPSLCPDEIATLRERFGEDFPIVLGFYARGHSRLGETTPEYVEQVMQCGHEVADGVHVYTHPKPDSPKYAIIKRLFGEWSAAE